jgi:fermentation-respiration switch protein FrsA (DUF1100 family)
VFDVAAKHAQPAPAPRARLPNVPILLLAGDRDLITPIEWARHEAAGAPRATLLIVAGAGHSVQFRAVSARVTVVVLVRAVVAIRVRVTILGSPLIVTRCRVTTGTSLVSVRAEASADPGAVTVTYFGLAMVVRGAGWL